MRRLLRAVSRRVGWPLARMAAGSVACFTIAGLALAGIGTRAALIGFGIVVGLAYLDLIVAQLRALPRDRAFDLDDQVDIKFMRTLPRWLRTLVFAAVVAGIVTAFSGMAAVAAAGPGAARAFALVPFAAVAAAGTAYWCGKGLAERALLWEKADRLRGRQRMAEVAVARAVRAARHPAPDPDAAIRRRIAERAGTLAPPTPRDSTAPNPPA